MRRVIVERRGNILIVRLDLARANAIDAATSREMGNIFVEYQAASDLRCAIVTGTGKFFSVGWDLAAAAAGMESESSDFGVGGFAGLTELFQLTKPVIAAVNGLAMGGGFELALACDLILAADTATFSLPEVTLGLIADAGGVQRLPRRLPYHIAMELLLTGREMGAAEAGHFGLVNRVYPPADLMPQAIELADRIARAAPLAVWAIKQVVAGTERRPLPEAFAALRSGTFPLYQQMLKSEDHDEGPRAFMEKRSPVFKGR